MTAIVKSRLVFLDSDAVSIEGDKLQASFPSGQITAGDGQFLRVSLQSFSMIKNFYNINPTNNTVAMKAPGAGKVFVACSIPPMNYATYNEIADACGKAIATQLQTELPVVGTVTVTDVSPASGKTSADTGNRVMSFALNCTGAHGLSTGDLILQTRDFQTSSVTDTQMDQSDSYEILGGKRITDPTSTSSSFNIDVSDPNKIVVKGYFPMQRFTQTDVFLHCDLCSTNYASSHYSKENAPSSLQLFSSTIFAKMHIYDESIVYDNLGGGAEYFFDIFQDSLTNITFSIRDCNGRVITEVATDQKLSGNFNCNMSLRVDTVAYGASGFARLKGPLDDLVDVSSDARRNLVTQGKPAWRLNPQPAGLNGQFFSTAI